MNTHLTNIEIHGDTFWAWCEHPNCGWTMESKDEQTVVDAAEGHEAGPHNMNKELDRALAHIAPGERGIDIPPPPRVSRNRAWRSGNARSGLLR